MCDAKFVHIFGRPCDIRYDVFDLIHAWTQLMNVQVLCQFKNNLHEAIVNTEVPVNKNHCSR